MKKEFKTLQEQVDILKEKNLIVKDEERAKRVLLRENYFFINGYRHVFYKSIHDKRFNEGTTFEEIHALFLFDREFRNIMFKNILIVENNIKSIFSYQLSKKYGYKEKEYLKPSNFSKDPLKVRQVNDLLRKMKRQVRVNSRQHEATLHYLNNYGYIPLWVLVKVLSFGIISETYDILKPEDQLAIASLYDLNVEDLTNYLPILANYRNLCAHEDILFEHRTQRVICDTKYHLALNIPIMNEEYIYGKNDLFAVLIILKQMLTKEQFEIMTVELDKALKTLDARLDSISLSKILDRMGFPPNWLDIRKV